MRDEADPTTSPIVYIINLTNNGPEEAEAAGFVGFLPAGTSLIGWTGASCGTFGARVTCGVGDFPAGASREIRLRVSAPAGDYGFTVDALTLTTDPVGSNNSASESTRVTSTLKTTESTYTVRVTYRSVLDVETREPGVHGQILINGSVRHVVAAGAAISRHFDGRRGVNRFEASFVAKSGLEGPWRFDFSGSDSYQPGSIRVESGQVSSLDGFSVVFLARRSERILFTVRVRDESLTRLPD